MFSIKIPYGLLERKKHTIAPISFNYGNFQGVVMDHVFFFLFLVIQTIEQP